MKHWRFRGDRLPGRVRVLALAASFAFGAGGILLGHESPATAMYLDYELREDAVVMTIEGAVQHFPPLAGIDPAAPPDDKVPAAEALGRFLADSCPVRLDGEEVPPDVISIEFTPLEDEVLPGRMVDLLLVFATVTYPAAEPPGVIDLTWTALPKLPAGFELKDFEETGHVSLDEVIASYRVEAGAPEFFTFAADSETLRWTVGTPRLTADGPSLADLQDVQSVAPVTITVPWLSIALGALALGVLAARIGVLAAWKFRWRTAVVLGAAAFLARGVWASTFAMPPSWSGGADLTADEAEELFAALHRNIYAAFDGETESEIYDVLARSVDGPLLDETYTEVYQSLVMREAEGAVATVEDVNILGAEAAGTEDMRSPGGIGYRIRCRWQVRGVVAHSNHVHMRTNEYQARYQLGVRDGQWKIVAAEALASDRLLPGADGSAGQAEAALFPDAPAGGASGEAGPARGASE